MKKLILAALLPMAALAQPPVWDAGNSTAISTPIGSSTMTTGTSPSGSWSQTTTSAGDVTIQSGSASDGTTWNTTTHQIGDSTITTGTVTTGKKKN